MSCLGVHFALTTPEIEQLRAIPTDEDRIECLRAVIEPHYFSENQMWMVESGKSWDAIHRVLTDGQLEEDGGTYPLNHTILGGEALCSGFDFDYVMSFKTVEQVMDIAAALSGISEEDFRERYLKIDREDYAEPLSAEDLAASWDAFLAVRDLYLRSATESRGVLFTVDQ